MFYIYWANIHFRADFAFFLAFEDFNLFMIFSSCFEREVLVYRLIEQFFVILLADNNIFITRFDKLLIFLYLLWYNVI